MVDSNLCCKDILQFIFNLNSADIEVFRKLKQTGEVEAKVLAKLLNKERSTIYRSLQRLTKSGLCEKNKKIIESGGYYHTYNCKGTKITSKRIETCLDNWYYQMKKSLTNLEKEIS